MEAPRRGRCITGGLVRLPAMFHLAAVAQHLTATLPGFPQWMFRDKGKTEALRRRPRFFSPTKPMFPSRGQRWRCPPLITSSTSRTPCVHSEAGGGALPYAPHPSYCIKSLLSVRRPLISVRRTLDATARHAAGGVPNAAREISGSAGGTAERPGYLPEHWLSTGESPAMIALLPKAGSRQRRALR